MCRKAKVELLICCFFVIFSSIIALQDHLMLLEYKIEEEQPKDTFVGDVYVDSGLYRLHPNSQKPTFHFLKNYFHFHIDNTTGIIKTAVRIDREDPTLCFNPEREICEVKLDLFVRAHEHRIGNMMKVKVIIVDINDNNPYFMNPEITVEVPESSYVGSEFALASAIDYDSTELSVKSYRLLNDHNKFKLKDGGEGSPPKLILTQPVDREAIDTYTMVLIAVDGGEPRKTGSVNVVVSVTDVNDNAPEFSHSSHSTTISENMSINTIIALVKAQDKDEGLNGQVEYSFAPATETQFGHLFGINETTGDVFVKGIIDYEKYVVYNLIVTAKDKGSNPLSSSIPLVVHVADANDNPPEISVTTLSSSGNAEIEENSPKGTFVAHVSVTDKDSGQNGKYTCHLDNSLFTLKASYDGEFQIITNEPLNREQNSFYNLALACNDFGIDSQTSITYIGVDVLDENDNSPVFTSQLYEGEIFENNFIGVSILTVNASDADDRKNAEISYQIQPPQTNDLFTIDETTGVISAVTSINREVHGEQIKFMVVAEDHGSPSRSSTCFVTINVLDVNDEFPAFSQQSYSFAVPENQPDGTEVGTVAALDLDGAVFGDVTYSMISDVFEISPKTGKIVTLVKLDREQVSAYHVIVMAKDGGVPPLSSSASVTIYVSDENDNSAIFLFPLHPNNSIQISTMTPKDHVICRIKAQDQDTGKNGKIYFYLKNSTATDGLFSIDAELGTLSILGDMKDKDGMTYSLELKAQDGGSTPRVTYSKLNVVVNKSVSFVWKPSLDQTTDTNMTLILIIAPISAVVVTALVIAIVILCCQERQRSSNKYNCRLETLKLQQSQPEKNLCHDHHVVRVKDNYGGRSKNFVMEDALNECLPMWTPEPPSYSVKECSPGFLNNVTSNTYSSCPFKPSASKKQSSCKSPINSKRMGRQRCADGESINSGYASNTDSGHGPSEEGESANKYLNSEHSQGTIKSRPPQSKPSYSTSNNFDGLCPNHSSESAHSYSTHPGQMSTFQGTPRKNYAPDLILNNTAYSPASFGTFNHQNSPYSNRSHVPLTAPCLSSESQRKLLEVEEELSQRTGSVEINCDFLPHESSAAVNASPSVSRGDVPRGAIDADDLCNEIDKLFFKDSHQPCKWKKIDH